MIDRESLIFAAKAAGKSRVQWDYEYCRSRGHMATQSMMWNPLIPAEAITLAASLRIDVTHNHPADQGAWVCAEAAATSGRPALVMEDVPDEIRRLDCMCHAIVRAAAEIGKAMP